MAYLISLMRLFYSNESIALEAIFMFIGIFLKNTQFFGGFLSVPNFVDIYAETADERGRNFLWERTIPSHLFISMISWIYLPNSLSEI